MKIRNYVLMIMFFLVGCGPRANMEMSEQKYTEVTISNNIRFEITRAGIFEDDLAYDKKRGIYIIKDRQTGVEYVGVSGIGISEVGRHSAGKFTVPDEK